MNRLRGLLLIGCLTLMVLAASGPSAGAAKAVQYGRYIRIPSDSFNQIDSLALTPLVAEDYGTFRWLQLSETDYAKLVASGAAFTEDVDGGKVQVMEYLFDPALGEPAIAPHLRADESGAGFYLIQLIGPTKDEWLDGIRAAGLPILQYYPHNSFLTWGRAEQLNAIANQQFVRWAGVFHPAYKMHQDLLGRNGRISNVDIMFYNDGHISDTLRTIQILGGNILQYYPSQPDKTFYDAIVQIDATRLDQLAHLNTVLWFGYASPVPVLDDEMSSQIVAGNHPGGIPVTGYAAHLAELGVDGSGVIWAVIDTGVDYNHPDLGSHIVGGYSFPGACNPAGQPGSDCSGGGHGTHVAGIVGGDATAGFMDGLGFLYGLGIAPAYSIFAMNSLSAPSWPPAGGWQEHSRQAILGNAIGGNNSWTTGEGTAHGYQASERTHDLMVRDGNFGTTTVAEPFIEVFSAGNSGPGAFTLTAPKEGKNLIVVASSMNYRVGNINNISSFSSRGPSVDGRFVPTVTAPGEQIASARNDLGGSCSTPIGGTNNLYAFCSGTSMAAPQVSGAIVLLTEWWRAFNTGANPSPAMAKALLVNGAVDMGTADIPNFNEGWGRINITNIISPSVEVAYRDQLDVFANTGEQFQWDITVPDPSKPLKITIAWTDAPGAVGANPALVNNLHLTVVNNGNTYLGNRFSAGWSITGGTADNLNNLENVYIQNPDSTATVTVSAASINGDGIPYNADTTDQDFVVVCSNCSFGFVPTYGVDLSGDETAAAELGQVVTYTVAIENSGNMSDTFDLSLSGNSWESVLSTTAVTLTAGSTSFFDVWVTIPADVPVWSSDTATITATSQGDPTESDSAVLTTTAAPTYGLELSASAALSGTAGSTVTYTLYLTNTGNFTDTYNLEAVGEWGVTLDPTVTVAEGESGSFTVWVEIPISATVGSSSVITVTVTSQGDDQVNGSTTLTTSVIPTVYKLYLPTVRRDD